MKKIFLCFAVGLLFMIASCGDVTVNTPDTSDSGETVTDDDTGNTGSTDSEPTGDTTPEPKPGDDADTTPDNGDTTPDNGDTTPDEGDTTPDNGDTTSDNGDTTSDNGDTTPDEGDTTSDDDADTDTKPDADVDTDTTPDDDPIIVEPTEKEKCEKEGGTYNEDGSCKRTVAECDANGLEHYVWNNGGKFTQTLSGEEWLPATKAAEFGNGECGFSCVGGYFWNDVNCVNGCTGDPCNSDPNSTGVCTSTGETTYECGCTGGYEWNEISQSCEMTSETLCTVVNGGHWYDDGTCMKTVYCDPIPATIEHAEWNGAPFYTQTLNGNDWFPETQATIHSDEEGVCHFKCANSYFWKNRNCVNGCTGDPCNNDTNSTGVCTSTGMTTFECGCNDGYYWNGTTCKKTVHLAKICTGQTRCYNYDKTVACPAPGRDFYGQDAQYVVPENGNCIEHSFSIDETVEGEKTVVDNNTGLEWQPTQSTETFTWEDAPNYCETSSYGGHDDWRVPSPQEFLTIADAGKYNPAVDQTYFIATSDLWTSKKNDVSAEKALRFSSNGSIDTNIEDTYPVMCVRGKELPVPTFTVSDDEKTVTDDLTGLVWQKTYVSGKTWQQALEYCENLDYAGYSDWRLPNKNELASLMNYGKASAPYSDFPDMPTVSFHSSSSDASRVSSAWNLKFNSKYIRSSKKYDVVFSYTIYSESNVRCVRSDICEEGKFWNGSQCVNDPCESDSCNMEHATGNCQPRTSSAFECICEGGYSWNNGTCKKTEEVTCENGGGTWNNGACECDEGYDWNGTTCALHEATEEEICNAASGTNWNNGTCECTADGYFWNGSACVDPCESVQCTQNAECVATSLTETSCNCVAGYFADGENCVNPCESAPCNSINNAVSDSCAAIDANTYTCECESGYDWNAGNLTCDATAETICMSAGGTNWDGSTCTRTQTCDPITVENADWNGASSYTQTYNFETEKWDPEYETEYSETVGECCFACINGYSWNNGACEKTAATICGEGGGTWNGSQCTIDGFPVCSATSATPCIDPETRLIWSSKTTGVAAANIISQCQGKNYGGYSDWHTPTISQLRTLVQGCPDLEPGGACGVTGNCSGESCWNNECSASSCTNLSKLGDDWLMSSTLDGTEYNAHWGLYLGETYINASAIMSAGLWHSADSDNNNIRCTRCADEGYEWNGTACVEPTEEDKCVAAGYYWDGTHCTLDGFTVCSATSDTPCIDPETRLIWSKAFTGVAAANIISKCEDSTEGGYSDWQTATISQLRTLVSSCDAEALGLGGTCGVTDNCSALSSCYDINDCDADCTNSSKLGDSTDLTSSTPDGTSYNAHWMLAFGVYINNSSAIFSLGFWGSSDNDNNNIRCTRCADEGYEWNGTTCAQQEMTEQEICENGGGNWINGTCSCYPGYNWNGTTCALPTEEENCTAAGGTWNSATQTCKKRYLCSAKPANTEWNGWGVNEYEAPYPKPDGYVAPLTQYSEDWGDCTFVCADGYAWDWNDSICAVTASKCSEIGGSWNEALSACTRLANCSIYDPDHIVWNDGGRNGKFTQTTKNGTDWSPGTLQSTYSEEPGDCHITCEEDYYLFTLFWGDTQLDKCTNGCVNDPCADMAHSNHTCTRTGATTYTCGCDNGYVWTGTSCDSIQLCSPSSTYPCFDSETGLLWSSKTTGVADADVVSHCETSREGEYNDWETPTISQLRSLITNCAKLELGGACGVTDYCTSSSCWVSSDCRNLQCNGQLSKTGDTELVSSNLSSNNVFWEIYLTSGSSGIIAPTDKNSYDVRCSRCYFNDQRWNPLLSKCSSINNPEKAECAPIPIANAVWNDYGNNGKVDQTWNYDSWEPTTIPQTTYSTTPGTCHYKCKTNYIWKNGSCIFVKDNLCETENNVFPCYFESTVSGTYTENILSEEFPAMNYNDAVNYCNNLKNYGNISNSPAWQLPLIDDLRALVFNCSKTAPGGSCGVTHSCLTSHSSSSTCYDDNKCRGCGTDTWHNNFYAPDPENMVLRSQDFGNGYTYVLNFDNAAIYGLPSGHNVPVRCIKRVLGLNP